MTFREFKDYRKVIVAGSRTFNDYNLLCSVLKKEFTTNDILVCGGAKGADSLGEKFAIQNNIALSLFLADWDKYGMSAGIIRNEQMANFSNELIAFWDGKSAGTGNMIKTAGKHNLRIKVITI